MLGEVEERAGRIDSVLHRFAVSDVLPYLPLAGGLVAAVVMYFPSLTSAFVSDDYVYLYSVKSVDVSEYLRDSVVPGSHSETLVFVDDFWRPLYFLGFQVTARVFGDRVELYHLLNLTIHLANVCLVWLLAQRLGTTKWAAGLGAAVFAIYPAAPDAVTWISSYNIVGFTFGLAAMLAFMSAVHASGRRALGLHLVAALLLVVGLLFRETAVSFLGLAAGWYLLVERRHQLLEPRTWLALVPFAAVCVLYLAIRTRLFTVEASNPYVGAALGWHDLEHAWFYVRLAALPVVTPESSELTTTQRVLGAVLIAAFPLALIARRWLIAACLAGLLLSTLPAASIRLGVSARYFYFTGAMLGVTVAAVADELAKLPPLAPRAGPVLAVATVLVLLVGTPYGVHRVDGWVTDNPEVHEAWVDEFRAENPTLAPGTHVYVTGSPLLLALFGGFVIQPTLAYYYPDIGEVTQFDLFNPAEKPNPAPGDVVFIYDGKP